MCCARYQVNIIELTFLLIILYWKMIMKRTLTDRNVNFPFVDENTSCLLKKWKWLVLKTKPSTWYIVTHKLRSVISHVITFQVALTLLTSTTKPKKRLKIPLSQFCELRRRIRLYAPPFLHGSANSNVKRRRMCDESCGGSMEFQISTLYFCRTIKARF